MITCKFTENELRLMRYGVKYLCNKHREVAQGILNEYVDKNGVIKKLPECYQSDETDTLTECCKLIGNIDSLIRNNK